MVKTLTLKEDITMEKITRSHTKPYWWQLPYWQKENDIARLIGKFNNKLITDSEFDYINEHELVASVENLGWSGEYDGLHWWSVEFVNGLTMDIYTSDFF